jgi:hypothetical protein
MKHSRNFARAFITLPGTIPDRNYIYLLYEQ